MRCLKETLGHLYHQEPMESLTQIRKRLEKQTIIFQPQVTHYTSDFWRVAQVSGHMSELQAHGACLELTSYWERDSELLQLGDICLTKVAPMSNVGELKKCTGHRITGSKVSVFQKIITSSIFGLVEFIPVKLGCNKPIQNGFISTDLI